jgi:hypothetical protein
MNRAVLGVTDARLTPKAGTVRMEGVVGGEPLFWEVPHRESIELRGEPFVAASLVSAMATDRAIELPDSLPIDAGFLESVEHLQTIFLRWFPALSRSEIRAAAVRPRARAPLGHMTGFSGGVDSSYAIVDIHDRIDAAVLCDGIEFPADNPALMAEVRATLCRALEPYHLPLLTVTTNVKHVGRALGGRWSQFIGGALASIPHALGVAEYWIAGSNSWENLRPYGTHPLTDPLWSSPDVQIRHHGPDARRIDKLRIVAERSELLTTLRVCFQGRAYNCGTCHKCLQTSAALRALRIDTPAMPPLRDPRLLRTMVVEHDGDLVDWAEILVPGLDAQDAPLARELRRLIWRYRTRQALKQFAALTVGRLSGRPTRRRS